MIKAKPYDMVPLADRLRYMQCVRVGMAALVVLLTLLRVQTHGASSREVLLATGGYGVISVLSELTWRLSRRRGITLFGAMLISDGFYIAAVTYLTGGLDSPLRFLVLLHVVTVSLLASYRTGMKLALWHSLLLFTVYRLIDTGVLRDTQDAGAAGERVPSLVAFIALAWLLTILTSSFSAINERELRRRRFDLEALAALARRLEDAATSHDVAAAFAAAAADAFGFRRLVVFGRPHDSFAVLASHGMLRLNPDAGGIAADSMIERAATARATVLVSQTGSRRDVGLEALIPEARNLVVVPLSAEGRCIGVLVAEHRMRSGSRIERRVVSTLEGFASQTALALRNAWLLESVQDLAATDGLTGIANRRSFERALEQEIARASRTGHPLSLVMIDIDHFKALNDTHGHQVGDQVLRDVAGVIAASCRQFDTAARYGGEEFAVLLPGCDPDTAARTARRLRLSIAELRCAAPVTASLGVASWPADAGDASTLVQCADDALYASKRAGRNRVTVAESRNELHALSGGLVPSRREGTG